MPRPFSSIVTEPVASGRGQNPGTPGPPGPPGPGFSAGLDLSGTQSEQSVVGFRARPLTIQAPLTGQSYVYDGVRWALGAGGAADVDPLSRTLFVDGGTTIELLSQDGSVARPFKEISTAAAAIASGPSASNWVLLVGPGSYGAVTFTGPHDVTVIGPSTEACTISQITVNVPSFIDIATPRLTLRELSVTGFVRAVISAYTAVLTVVLQNAEVGGAVEEVGIGGTSLDMRGIRSSVGSVNVTGSFAANLGTVNGDVACNAARLEGTSLPGTGQFSALTATLYRCMTGQVQYIGGGTYSFDGPTMAAFTATGSQVPTGTLVCDDYPDYLISSPVAAATPTSFLLTDLPVGESVTVDFTASATEESVAMDCALYRIVVTFRNISGTPEQVGPESELLKVEDDPSWSVSFSFAANKVFVVLTGDSVNVVDWTVLARRTSTPYRA